jgi:hypothetical protein
LIQTACLICGFQNEKQYSPQKIYNRQCNENKKLCLGFQQNRQKHKVHEPLQHVPEGKCQHSKQKSSQSNAEYRVCAGSNFLEKTAKGCPLLQSCSNTAEEAAFSFFRVYSTAVVDVNPPFRESISGGKISPLPAQISGRSSPHFKENPTYIFLFWE